MFWNDQMVIHFYWVKFIICGEQQQKYMQARRQAVIHRKLISNQDIQSAIDKQHPSSLPKQSSKELDHPKNSRISKMGRPKKHSLSIHSQKLGDGFLKFDLITDDDRKRLNAKTRNIFTFFPTYTQLIDNQISDFVFNKTIPINDPIEDSKYFSTIPHSEDKIAYERKKLAPIRKPKSQKGSENKKNSNVSFLNVEKLSLQRMGDSTERDKDKMATTASYISRRNMSLSRNSYQISKASEIVDVPQLKVKHNSFREENTPIVRIKPFIAPFERFYYFDFLWKIAFSNGIKTEFLQTNPKKYKVYIGGGNNSMLIKTLFKRRDSWWSITTNMQQANFIWTQIKVGSVFNCQQKNTIAAENCAKSIQSGQKKTVAYKRNLKIMNQHDTQTWMSYYHKNKQIEQKLDPRFQKRNRVIRKKKQITLNIDKVKIHNHFPRNYVIGNKKALFSTMKKYYECSKKDVFQYLPLTFHIENGLEDPEYFKFLQFFYKKAKTAKQSEEQKKNKIRNIWIVKPGQFTNRGNGITVCRSLEEVKSIVKNRKKLETGGMRTYIVQQYLDRPFLYQRRKFDIRHYMMISSVNGHIKGYWYELGYIRTTSYEYSVKNGFSSVHLTNDAVQKQLPDYGKYEKGNKVSYDEFEKYLEAQYNGKYSFYKMIYPQMKLIAKDCMRASAGMLDENRKGHNFEIFGFDFMIDCDFKPWLIEINTNPCLELNCPILMDIIPNMLQNTIKIGVDSLLPPPYSFSEKRARFSNNILDENKFELLFDSTLQEQELNELFKADGVKLNFKQLEKDQQELYEDDGVQLED